MASDTPERYRFDVFEFIVSTGELLRRGHKLRLSSQQARLLMALLERSGEVVSREELRLRLWPSGEYLDYGHAIRNAINQLRAVLRDTHQKQAFIETLPKRGYRFVARVEEVFSEPETGGELNPVNVETAPIPLPDEEPAVADRAVGLAEPVAIHRPRRWWPAAAVVAILLLAIGSIAIRMAGRAGHKHSTPGAITLGIAPIEATGQEAQKLAEPFRSDLVDAAAQLPGVEVRATHSFPPPAAMGDLRELAQKLQLDALLLGKIEAVDANHFNFGFELVRGSDAVHLASLHYSGTAAQLGGTRDQIQRDLFFHLSSATQQRLTPVHSTENPSAYSAYLSARAELIRHDDAAIRQAAADFEQAVKADPEFAQAYAGLGSAYLLLAEHAAQDREAAYEAAHFNSVKAVSLNPNLGEAHATLAFLDFRHDWNAAAAETEFRRAVELDPNQAMHRILFALLLCNTGRSTEALEQIARAHAADPLWPPVYITEIYVASAARQNDRALQAAHTLIEMMPNWSLAYDQSAWAYWYAGRYEEAVKEWIRMAKLEQDQPRLALEVPGLSILRRRGMPAYARYKLEAIARNENWNHPNDFQKAEWQINAGQDTEALASLAEMVRAHDPESLQFAASPAYLKLHGKPVFNGLLKQVGLPQP